jgi:hypothetical protein
MRIIYKLFILSLLAQGSVAFGLGSTILATNTSVVAVQAAINAATRGDTVLIPEGSNFWTSQLVVSKAITLEGSGTGKTIITDGWGNSSLPLIKVVASRPGLTRLTGITFYQSKTTPSYAVLQVSGGTANAFRFDNMEFKSIIKKGIWAIYVRGVIDHCLFQTDENGSAQALRVDGNNYDTPPKQSPDSYYAKPATFGTTDAVYIEDCVLDFFQGRADSAFELYYGGKYVVRNCLITNVMFGVHGCDSGARSGHSFEVYNNTWCYTGVIPGNQFGQLRGGTGMIFSNNFYTTYSGIVPSLALDEYRCSYTNIYAGPSCQFVAGWVTGTNRVDGNSDDYGYPALDQIGRTGPTVFGVNKSSQVLQPLYCWSNTFSNPNLTQALPIYVAHVYTNAPVSADKIIQKGRDYFDGTVAPDYTPLKYPHPFTSDFPTPSNLRAVR